MRHAISSVSVHCPDCRSITAGVFLWKNHNCPKFFPFPSPVPFSSFLSLSPLSLPFFPFCFPPLLFPLTSFSFPFPSLSLFPFPPIPFPLPFPLPFLSPKSSQEVWD